MFKTEIVTAVAVFIFCFALSKIAPSNEQPKANGIAWANPSSPAPALVKGVGVKHE
jgi:hypothetical protein